MHPEIPQTTPNKIRILHRLEPLLHLIQVYNANNFTGRSWRAQIRKVVAASAVTLANCTLFAFIGLIVWNLLGNVVDVGEVAVSMPIVTSLSWTASIAVDMMWRNGIVSGAFEQLQSAVDHRQCLVLLIFCLSEKQGLSH